MPTTIDIESQRMLLGSTPVRKIYQGPNLLGTRIAELFANGEQGVWYDPSDFSTLFQDVAGTIPVTGVEQPVGLMLDKSGRGNHASQPTATSRPVLSARVNLLSYSEQFSDAVWVKFAASITANVAISPDGTMSADKLTESTALDRHFVYQNISVTSGASYTFSVFVKSAGRSTIRMDASDGQFGVGNYAEFNLSSKTVTTYGNCTAGIDESTQGYLRCYCTLIAIASGASTVSVELLNGTPSAYAGDGTSGIYIWGADLRVANNDVNLPPYQRIDAGTDYDTQGFPQYLRFDGVDDHLNIGVLNMSAASTAGYFSAIAKLSDAVIARWYSHGLTTAVGSIRLSAPANPGKSSVRAGFYSTTGVREVGGTAHAAPITLTVKCEIEPSVGMWITHNNGSQLQTTVDPTVFSANGEACIGAQVSSSSRGNFFNGRIYALLVVGRKSSGSEQAAIEAYLRTKSRAY